MLTMPGFFDIRLKVIIIFYATSEVMVEKEAVSRKKRALPIIDPKVCE